MLRDESLWIKYALERLNLAPCATVLDLGSSSLKHRTMDQPYIDENVFAPLRQRGLRIIHADKKIDDGIDIIIDINAVKLKEQYDLVLCTNLLEHVLNPVLVAKKALDLVKDGGYLLVSIPNDFPYHPDPLDTMFRPTNRELEKMFSGQRIMKSEIFSADFYGKRCKISILLLKKVKSAKIMLSDYLQLRIPWRERLFSGKIYEYCIQMRQFYKWKGIRLWYSMFLPVALYPRNCFRKLYQTNKGHNNQKNNQMRILGSRRLLLSIRQTVERPFRTIQVRRMFKLTYKRPLYLIVETVNTCNAHCVFCCYGKIKIKPQVLPLDIFEKVIREYSEMGGGAVSLTPCAGRGSP